MFISCLYFLVYELTGYLGMFLVVVFAHSSPESLASFLFIQNSSMSVKDINPLFISFFSSSSSLFPLIWCMYAKSQRRQWHPTLVLLPGNSHGWRSLVGCSPWGCEVRHNWATSLSLFTLLLWRRKRQPTPVFLPGESQGQGSLVGCHLWGRVESDTTEST